MTFVDTYLDDSVEVRRIKENSACDLFFKFGEVQHALTEAQMQDIPLEGFRAMLRNQVLNLF